MSKMDPVVHFEMPYDDRDRAANFYSQVFGWQANKMGDEMGQYMTVYTAETDPQTRMLKEPGRINGGFYSRKQSDQGTTVVIAVENLEESMKKVQAAGGEIIGGGHKAGEPDDIPGIGLYISIRDSEGNVVGMLQPKGM